MKAAAARPVAPFSALILAGSRGAGDPLAAYAGVSHKALIAIDGHSMLERVATALAQVAGISRIAISIEQPELVEALLGREVAGIPVEVRTAAGSPAASVADALRHLGTPLLVTTADHALLRPEWVRYLLDHCPAGADVAVALASRAAILEAVPDTQRTYLRFADGAWSGCNLFFFARAPAAGAVGFWREVEAERKHPLRMIRRLGPRFALRYLAGRLSLGAALARLETLSGARIAKVEMPFGRAAIDVDKPTDLELVRRLLAGDRARNPLA